MKAAEVDAIIEKVSGMVGGDDQGLFAFILRMAADKSSNTDEFAAFAFKMLEKTYGVAA